MRIKLVAITGVILLSPLYAATASSVDQLVVFGDSLSDNGNVAAGLASVGQTLGNYAPNAFTDGPHTTPPTTGPFGLWVDQFASKFGLPDPAPIIVNTAAGLAVNPAGTNFAVGSAQTGHNPAISLGTLLSKPPAVPFTTDQVDLFNSVNGSSASPHSLYSFWAGSDDISNALTSNPFTVVSAAKNAADNIESNIKTLAGEGGKYFLWFNLPPLGETPAVRASGPLATLAANTAASAFNDQMNDDITSLLSTMSNIVIIGVDVHGAFEQIEGDPHGFGFDNITDPAQGQSVDPNKYLFWDGLHPTTAGDAVIADLAATDASRFVSASPEPASLGLAFFGILGLFGVAWRRRFRLRLP